MTLTLEREATTSQTVGMGQIAVGKMGTRLTAVLGSCIGLAIFHPRLRLGALAHIVLPHANHQSGPPGKYADTAIPHMLDQLRGHGALPPELKAKVVGGACMFASNGPIQIGAANAQAVLEALAQAGVRVVVQETGGACGRRVSLDCGSGEVTVETAGAGRKTL